MEPIPRYRFERIVQDAIDLIPDELSAVLDNVAIVIEDSAPDEPDLLGVFDGVPITERNDSEVASVITMPAPPTARLPRWTRCQFEAIPSRSSHEY